MSDWPPLKVGASNLEDAEYSSQDRARYRASKANWDAFDLSMQEMEIAVEQWADRFRGIKMPWLCWNVNEEWCLVQQRLARHVGWTPVVGFDPRAGAPRLLPESVLVDFNAPFGYPGLHMVFPLEFVYLFADRLAFWHSDLLVRLPVLERVAREFESLKDGVTCAVDIRSNLYNRLRGIPGRYWELLGCTTRAASRAQFDAGSGWWRHISRHPNCPIDTQEKSRRERYGYDHGAGILYWRDHYHGEVRGIRLADVEEGHCSRVGNANYVTRSPQDERRDLTKDLSYNYDLAKVCKQLGLEEFLHD